MSNQGLTLAHPMPTLAVATALTPLFSSRSSLLRFFSSRSLSLTGGSEPMRRAPGSLSWLWEPSQPAVMLLWESDMELEQDG